MRGRGTTVHLSYNKMTVASYHNHSDHSMVKIKSKLMVCGEMGLKKISQISA